MNKVVSTLFIFLSLAICKVTTYHYDVSFRRLDVGKSTITIEKTDDKIFFSTILTTNKSFDWLYSIRDTISVVMNSRDWSLLKTRKSIKEGSFKQFHYAEVDTLNQLITYGNKSIPYSDKIYDPLGLLFYLRDRDQSKIKDLVYDVYDSKRKIKIKFDVIDGKEIKFNNVNHRTFFLDPKSVDGKKLLKNDGHIRFWFSKEDRSPIQIQQTTNYGKIIMKLVNVDEE